MEEMFDFYHWLKNWERVFKKSHDLLFVLSVRNIVEYLDEYLRSSPKPWKGKLLLHKESYEKTLLESLLNTIKRENLETKILKDKLPKIMEELEWILPLFINAKAKRHNECRLSILFVEINEFFISEEFYRELLKHLDLNTHDHDTVDNVTVILMRSLLTKFSTKKLETFPRDVFTKYFFQQKWTQIEDKIKKDETIKAEFDNLVDPFLEFGRDEAKTYSESNKLKKFLDEIKKQNAALEFGGYRAIQKSIESFESLTIFGSISSEKPIKENIDNFQKTTRLKEFSDVMDSIFDCIILCLSRIAVFKIFDKQRPGTNNKFSDMEFCNRYSDLIKSALYSNYEDAECRSFSHSVYIAIFNSVCNHISSMVSKTIIQNTELKKNHFKEKITQYVLDGLRNEENYKEKDIGIMEHIIHHFSFILLHVDVINELVDLSTKEIFLEIQRMPLVQVQQGRSLILTDISKRTLTHMEKHGHRSIPDTIPKQMFELLIKKLFDESIKKETHRVFCMIEGLDCNNKILRMENVTFYDGTKFDFGEGGALDRYSDHDTTTGGRFRVYGPKEIGQMTFEFKRNSGRAFVEVDASEPTKAIQLALIQVRDALSTLVHYSIAGRDRGFGPIIPSRYVVETKTSRIRSNIPDRPFLRPLEIRDETRRAVEFYGKLVQKNDPFDEVLLKGFSWYAKARWEPSTQDRFLALWIGLEQIFLSSASQGKKKRLLDLIPKLTITWWQILSHHRIGERLEYVVKLINSEDRVKNFLANNEATKNWEKNPVILLEHVDELRSNTEETVLERMIAELQDDLNKDMTESMEYEIELRRHSEKFKIARLWLRRNSIVHQGETYVSELDIMTNVLQNVLENIFSKTLRFKHEGTLEKIITETNRPMSFWCQSNKV